MNEFKKEYVMALDQSTTSSKTIILDKKGNVVAYAEKKFKQIYPQAGWNEHNAMEIWDSQLDSIREAVKKANIKSYQIKGLGITNQTHTVVVWNKKTGKPVYNAITWEDTRTSDKCQELIDKGFEKIVHKKTGLPIYTVPTATSLQWILENVEQAKKDLQKGELLAGTIDTWLMWKLSKGKIFATDVSNASRTLLFDINDLKFDDELLEIFKIPKELLAEVKPSSYIFGYVDSSIFLESDVSYQDSPVPISGVVADMTGALFGQLCFEKGGTKNTYGTSTALLTNTGNEPIFSKDGLLTRVAWQLENEDPVYAIEGNFLVSGSATQWIKDNLGIVKSFEELEEMASEIPNDDNQQVYFVPALTGLGAPQWDSKARGAIFGLERSTTKAHIARATLESIAYNTEVLFELFRDIIDLPIKEFRADGGVCQSKYLMKFQADISQKTIIIPENIQMSSTGAGLLAGLSVKFWISTAEIKQLEGLNKIAKVYKPNKLDKKVIDKKISKWKDAVSRVTKWVE